MIIIKNDNDKDMTIKVPGDKESLPVEVTLAKGEEYQIPDDNTIAKDILRWNFSAYFEGDVSTPAGDGETNSDEEAAVGEDGDKEVATVTNDKEFDVEVTYKDAEGEDKTATIKAGETLDVPADQEDAVKKQIADATDSSEEDAEDEDTEVSEEQKKLNDEKAELAKEKAKLVAEKAEMKFATLVSEGKLVPAQKDAFMALSTKATGEVAVAEGETQSVSELLESLVENGRSIKVGEEDGENGDGNGDEDEVELTEEDKETAAQFGNTEEELKEVAKEEKE